MDRGAWWATVHGVTKSHTRLSDFTQEFLLDQMRISNLRMSFVSNLNEIVKLHSNIINIVFTEESESGLCLYLLVDKLQDDILAVQSLNSYWSIVDVQ